MVEGSPMNVSRYGGEISFIKPEVQLYFSPKNYNVPNRFRIGALPLTM